jgi:acetyl esterase
MSAATPAVDPDLLAYNARVAAEVPRAPVATPDARRERLEAVVRRFPPPADDVARTDRFIVLPGRELLLRIYRPRDGLLPALLYLHGGGWVAGSVHSHDGPCAALARDAGVVVASLHYRRAPECPCPAANDDAYAALCWLAAHTTALGVDASRLAIGGDSAGAHLAAGAALEARERGGPALALQLLIYPVIEPDFDTDSYRRPAAAGTLTRDDMIQYWRDYLPQGFAAADWRALPAAATLAGLPRTHIVVAGIDPLRDEGVRYARLLSGAGVEATLVEAPTLTHGFLRAAPYVPAARQVQQALGRAAGRALESPVRPD